MAGCEKKDEVKIEPLHVEMKPLHADEIKDELKRIHTTTYLEEYIVKIINEGSFQNLGFATKTMDANLAHSVDALDIARFTILLRGEKSSDDKRAKKAEIFYTSNCGGCHGNDGKGMDGTFPDLTIKTMLGIQMREKFLKEKLKIKDALNNK